MVDISVSEDFKRICTAFSGAAVEAAITNTPSDGRLWQEIDARVEAYRAAYTVDSIKDMPAIKATRAAYKALGKDPSRYRPSSEALCRRVLRGMDLYRVNTAVDLINLVSMETGYSIGGFDADKIAGTSLVLGIGDEGEPYEGIGRGTLNIGHLPVYRDSIGGIGTPTSDNERTKIDLATHHVLIIVNSYGGGTPSEAANELAALLERYVAATGVTVRAFK